MTNAGCWFIHDYSVCDRALPRLQGDWWWWLLLLLLLPRGKKGGGGCTLYKCLIQGFAITDMDMDYDMVGFQQFWYIHGTCKFTFFPPQADILAMLKMIQLRDPANQTFSHQCVFVWMCSNVCVYTGGGGGSQMWPHFLWKTCPIWSLCIHSH